MLTVDAMPQLASFQADLWLSLQDDAPYRQNNLVATATASAGNLLGWQPVEKTGDVTTSVLLFASGSLQCAVRVLDWWYLAQTVKHSSETKSSVLQFILHLSSLFHY